MPGRRLGRCRGSEPARAMPVLPGSPAGMAGEPPGGLLPSLGRFKQRQEKRHRGACDEEQCRLGKGKGSSPPSSLSLFVFASLVRKNRNRCGREFYFYTSERAVTENGESVLKSQDGKGSFDRRSLHWHHWGSSRGSSWGQVTSETLPSPSCSSCSPCSGTRALSLVPGGLGVIEACSG